MQSGREKERGGKQGGKKKKSQASMKEPGLHTSRDPPNRGPRQLFPLRSTGKCGAERPKRAGRGRGCPRAQPGQQPRGAAGAPCCPAERGPGRLPGAGRDGGDARGREERDTREAATTHSLTHSQPRESSLPAPPSPPATSRREEPPALGATPPAGPPGRGGDPRAPQPRSPHRPECRAGGGENSVFDGGHRKGGRGAAPRRGEGDGKGELHHGPRGALPSRSPSTPRPPPALVAELGPGERPPRPREGKMERGRGGGTRGRGATLLTPPQPPRLAGRRRVRSALPPLQARRGAAAAAAAANRRQPPPLPQLAPVPLPASKWRQLVSGCSNGTAEGRERGQRGAAAPPAGPLRQHPQPAARPEKGGPGRLPLVFALGATEASISPKRRIIKGLLGKNKE